MYSCEWCKVQYVTGCVFLQEVSSLRCDQLLSSTQLLPADCVSGLVELVGSPNTDPTLLSAIIALLAQLGTAPCPYRRHPPRFLRRSLTHLLLLLSLQ